MKTTPAETENRVTGGSDARNQEYDEEFGIHPVRRPINIENDVTSLGQKKRVSGILRSPDFKEELETVVTDLLRSDRGGGHVIAQAIANVFSPTNRSGPHGIGCVSPINDLTGADTLLYSKGEKLLRCKLAALYRIVDLYGWTSAIYNHITVRVTQEHEHFLINPFGLLYHEVSASKLIKVNMQGEVLDPGSTTLGFNQAGYTLHSAIHSARPDLHCVIHLHTSDVIAVSCMDCGLLPISQEALVVGEVSYHNYQGILVDNKEKKSIQKHLGPNNKVMFLRNHGVVACGETVEEAFHYLYVTMQACSIQVKAMSCMKPEKLIQLDRSALKHRTEEVARKDVTMGRDSAIQWKVGEMMFEAHIRMLDDMGYRSGYSYRNPVIVRQKPKQKSDVQLPATSVGHTAVLPEDLEDARGHLRQHDRSHWVNSPNQYTRIVEVSEEGHQSTTSSQNGDMSPRMRTKWKRADESSKSSTVVRIAGPNQFVPTNTDPREVLATRKSIRGQGRYEHNRPGPQSQLLHSVSPADKASTGLHSSSKAIIEKGNEVELVTPAGPPNPFSAMGDNSDLKDYQKTVSRDDESVSQDEAPQNETTQHIKLEAEVKEIAAALQQTEIVVQSDSKPKASRENSGQMEVPVTPPQAKKDELASPSHVLVEERETKSVKADKSPKAESKAPKSPKHSGTEENHHNESGKKKKKRPLSFLKKKK